MREAEVTETICQALREFGHEPESVAPSTHLQDELGIDSLETVELSAMVCKQLGLPPSVSADVRDVRTVAELAARILPLLPQAEQASAPRESP